MIFDRERYERESMEPDHIAAADAFAGGDYETARTLWRQAYQNGSSLAAVKLGILYYRGYDVKRDRGLAVKFFEKGMEEGNPLGADWLARCFMDGRSLPVDIRKAQLLVNESIGALEEMAKAGDAHALYACGYRYKHGDGVNENIRKAYEYLGKAAEAQLLDAVVQLAEMCIEGPWTFGTGYNAKKAEELLLRYQDRSDCRIHALLGHAYFDAEDGFGYWPDKALQYLLTAAEMGDVPSQRRAGIYYLGVHPDTEKDYDEAVKWLDQAADNGDEEALEYLEKLYSFEYDWDYQDFEWKDEDEAEEYAWRRDTVQCYTKLCRDLENLVDKFTDEIRVDASVELSQIEQSLVQFAYAVFQTEESEEDFLRLQKVFESFCRTFAKVEGVSPREEIRYARFLADFSEAFPEIDIEGALVLLERAEKKSSLPYIACLLGLLNKGLQDDPYMDRAIEWYETAWDKAARLRKDAWSSDFGEYLPPAQGGFEDACLDDDDFWWEFGDDDYKDPDDDDTAGDRDAGDGEKKGICDWKSLSEEAKSCLITENKICNLLIECYEARGNRKGRFHVLRTLAPNRCTGSWRRELAVCYEKGDGTARDFDEAMRWYAAAAEDARKDFDRNNLASRRYFDLEYWKHLAEQKDRSAVRLWNGLTDACAALVRILEEKGTVTETDRAALTLARAVPEHRWEEPFSEFVRVFIEEDGNSGYEEIRFGRFLNGFAGAIRRYGSFLGGFVEVACRNDIREELALLEAEAAERKTPYLFSLLGNLYESDIPCKSLMKAGKCYDMALEKQKDMEEDLPGGERLEKRILDGLRRCKKLLGDEFTSFPCLP